MKKGVYFAPREVFNQILEWAVIPTFDLVIEYGEQGIILVKRSIAPYKNQWALPGLRMLKGESINDTIARIAQQEVGLTVQTEGKLYLGQYVGKFTTEHNRQDLSTCYSVKISDEKPIVMNKDHFSSYKLIKNIQSEHIGAMYKYYLEQYFKNRKR